MRLASTSDTEKINCFAYKSLSNFLKLSEEKREVNMNLDRLIADKKDLKSLFQC